MYVAQVLSPSLARLTGAGKSLVSMDLSQASAALRDMDSKCCCPLEMLRCINEADTSLAESASKLRHVPHMQLPCQGPYRVLKWKMLECYI